HLFPFPLPLPCPPLPQHRRPRVVDIIFRWKTCTSYRMTVAAVLMTMWKSVRFLSGRGFAFTPWYGTRVISRSQVTLLSYISTENYITVQQQKTHWLPVRPSAGVPLPGLLIEADSTPLNGASLYRETPIPMTIPRVLPSRLQQVEAPSPQQHPRFLQIPLPHQEQG